MRPFTQVDVFTDQLTLGNALAVIHDADGLSDETMAAVARWTRLAETTFLLPPTDPSADYRVRIFTPERELPFAGHPTVGSAWAWLAAGGVPRPGEDADGDRVVQECDAGLVRLRGAGGGPLAFAAPPLRRSGPVDDDDVATLVRGLRVAPDDVVDARWVDNGPGWVGVLLRDADAVLALEPDAAALGGLEAVGVAGPHPAGGEADVEVRAFTRFAGQLVEDPVTGSLNAGLGQWLIGSGRLPERYVAAQGTRLRRRGRVHVERVADVVWVGGDVTPGVRGTIAV